MKTNLLLIIVLVIAVIYTFTNMQGVHAEPNNNLISNHKADLLYNIYED